MVQISGYTKKHQVKNTKDLVKPTAFERAIRMIRGENKVVQIRFAHYRTFKWKKSYDPSSDLKYRKITVIDFQNALGCIWLRY